MSIFKKNNIVSDDAPSIIKDPFSKDGFDGLSVYVNRSWIKKDQFNITGRIQFKNGNTNGEQEFKNTSLDGLLLEMKHFLDNLK